jgi:hypothetical protein
MPLPAITPAGVSTATQYATQTSSGAGIDFAAKPGPTNAPTIFEPGPELSGNQYAVWMVATGAGPDWGGCEVHVSLEPTGGYVLAGIIRRGGVQGVLTANFASGGDPDTTHTLSVDLTRSRGGLTSVTTTDADAWMTPCLVDSEIVAYSAVTLTSAFHYNLGSYIRRGIYGTVIAAHSTGAPFTPLGAGTFRQRFPPHLIGTTIYVKLPAFNSVGAELEDLASVAYYPHTLTGAGVDQTLGCPVDVALAAGVTEFDWGLLSSLCTSAKCDWGKITDKLALCIDMGQLDASGGEYLFAPSVSLAGPADGGRLPNDGEELFVIELAYSAFLPAGLKDSVGGCRVAPTADAVFTLQKNNVLIGTATIAASATVATFVFAAPVSFAIGDSFTFLAPSPQDATLADLWFTFRGSREQ